MPGPQGQRRGRRYPGIAMLPFVLRGMRPIPSRRGRRKTLSAGWGRPNPWN